MSASLDASNPGFSDPALVRDCEEFESIVPVGKVCPVCGQPVFVRKADGLVPVYFDLAGHRFEQEQIYAGD